MLLEPLQKPGTPLFQRYKRCNWEIERKPEDDEDGGLIFPVSKHTTDIVP